jgi:hypothetical protein
VDSVFVCCFGSVNFIWNLYALTVADSHDSVVDPVPSGAILLDSMIGSVLVSVIDWVLNSVFDWLVDSDAVGDNSAEIP